MRVSHPPNLRRRHNPPITFSLICFAMTKSRVLGMPLVVSMHQTKIVTSRPIYLFEVQFTFSGIGEFLFEVLL